MVPAADNGSPGRLRPGLLACLATDEGRRQDCPWPEPSSDPVRHMREPFPSDGIGVEQVELTRGLRTERRGGKPDQAHALRKGFAREQGHHATVQLETILGRIAGLAPGDGPKVLEAELQRHAAGRDAFLAKLTAYPLGLSAQRCFQLATVVDVAAKGGFGAHGLWRSPRGDGPVVVAESELAQRASVPPETVDQNALGHCLELANGDDAQRGQRLRSHAADAPQTLDRQRGEECGLSTGRYL